MSNNEEFIYSELIAEEQKYGGHEVSHAVGVFSLNRTLIRLKWNFKRFIKNDHGFLPVWF